MKKNECKNRFISCGKFNKKFCKITLVLISLNVLIQIIKVIFNNLKQDYLDNENISKYYLEKENKYSK